MKWWCIEVNESLFHAQFSNRMWCLNSRIDSGCCRGDQYLFCTPHVHITYTIPSSVLNRNIKYNSMCTECTPVLGIIMCNNIFISAKLTPDSKNKKNCRRQFFLFLESGVSGALLPCTSSKKNAIIEGGSNFVGSGIVMTFVTQGNPKQKISPLIKSTTYIG